MVRQQRLDELDNVTIIFAHDASLKNIINEFPATLNDWLVKVWAFDCCWCLPHNIEV